jgi:hypothetical protein
MISIDNDDIGGVTRPKAGSWRLVIAETTPDALRAHR